jgi:hypothetical protein
MAPGSDKHAGNETGDHDASSASISFIDDKSSPDSSAISQRWFASSSNAATVSARDKPICVALVIAMLRSS